METVDGVTVVVYKEHGDYYRFAVLRRELNWEGWELVKGHIDDGETPEEAARREVHEETGIKIQQIEELDATHEWEYEQDDTRYRAEYDCFLAEAPPDALIDVSANDADEHSKGHFLNSRDTLDILTHENQRELVEQVIERLEAAG